MDCVFECFKTLEGFGQRLIEVPPSTILFNVGRVDKVAVGAFSKSFS
jgi:hypothetical protein